MQIAVMEQEGQFNTTVITGQTDFKGSAGTVNVNDTGTLAAVTSSAATNSNLVFLGGGNVTGVINNIGAIIVNGYLAKKYIRYFFNTW
ncbi:hypothetical protein [Rickettsia koreansis]|uniref:hypothetical protein n=1 Tax=Rickettsia koreansis TaxID=2358204 RepID=UPI00397D2609